MVQQILLTLEELNVLLWSYVGMGLLLTVGLYLSVRSRWLQIRGFPGIIRFFWECATLEARVGHRGVSPIRVLFASLGGCIGIGNLATVGVAVQIGGPGALLWMWGVALLGMIIKYSEIYLGLRYRVPNPYGSYDGGPMYFLQKAFPRLVWLPMLSAVLLGIYGVEIYMFNVVQTSIATNFDISPIWVMMALLIAIFIGVSGGVERIGAISSKVIPLFVVLYVGMTIWVVGHHVDQLPELLRTIFISAFNGHAAVGGFAGSTMMLACSKGISSAVYSGDMGVGSAAVIHSETSLQDPHKQASLAIFGIFLDTFIVCTCTVLLILVTGVWLSPLDGSLLVQRALEQSFPYIHIFMPFFLFILGYSTITAYLCAGFKCARFISPKYGIWMYYLYATVAFVFFSFQESMYALTIMTLSGGLLLVCNLLGIFKLRREIHFQSNF